MHPAERFSAPSSIQHGTPLKSLLDRKLVNLLAESLSPVVPGFIGSRFVREATRGLDSLELMPRAQHIAAAMARHLPAVPADAARCLIASCGPLLTTTAGNGLKPFFYLPHSACIERHLLVDWEAGMQACHALTRRFTAEFAIRPYIEADPARALERLAVWIIDPDPHVRRLVSEGTRPRLPWAGRLRCFQRDPAPMIPLLERLVDDPELYVRRSVANHVGDIAKDHPRIAFDLCRRWLAEPTAHRRQVVRHAVRLPARQEVAVAAALRRRAGGR
jgi:3-methyladenine DNA glycosylase AlkC